jgi:hypothetical protein
MQLKIANAPVEQSEVGFDSSEALFDSSEAALYLVVYS